jgi:hypothetical protein
MDSQELTIIFPDKWCNKYDIWDLRVIIKSRPEKTETGYVCKVELDDKIFRGMTIDELYDRTSNTIDLSEWKQC